MPIINHFNNKNKYKYIYLFGFICISNLKKLVGGHWTKLEGHSEEETYLHVGKRYPDNLLRFWTQLFIKDYNNIKTDYIN
jgi:hypothetical protein